ncbi:hypothetical protein RhiirB3_454221 [Rhizophagus irregularis]|nr:hypothetical protein RhiirB3_454221 [Rhizophagus irregularis]
MTLNDNKQKIFLQTTSAKFVTERSAGRVFFGLIVRSGGLLKNENPKIRSGGLLKNENPKIRKNL